MRLCSHEVPTLAVNVDIAEVLHVYMAMRDEMVGQNKVTSKREMGHERKRSSTNGENIGSEKCRAASCCFVLRHPRRVTQLL